MQIYFLIVILTFSSVAALCNEQALTKNCPDFFKNCNLRGFHNFNSICTNKNIKTAIEQDSLSYKNCIKAFNAVTPPTLESKYFYQCTDKSIRQKITEESFNTCIINLVKTGKSYSLNVPEICLDSYKRDLVINPSFTHCTTLLGEFQENPNIIKKCMDKNFTSFLERDDFKKCIEIKKELKDTENAIDTCIQPGYLQLMTSPDFENCIEKLKQINIYDKQTQRCTNIKFLQQILGPNFIPCINKLQTAHITQPLDICGNPTQSDIIISKEFDHCYFKLSKLEAIDPVLKCIQPENLKKINSPNFDLCLDDLIIYGNKNLDTYCINPKFVTLKSKRDFMACLDEAKQFNQSDIVNKCSTTPFLKHLHSPAYSQCKSNLTTMGIKHLIGPFCLEPANFKMTLNNQDIVCISKELETPSGSSILKLSNNILESVSLFNKIITTCKSNPKKP